MSLGPLGVVVSLTSISDAKAAMLCSTQLSIDNAVLGRDPNET